MTLRIFVAVATLGRAALVRSTIARLALQTRPPDAVVVATSTAQDAGGAETLPGVELVLAEKGLCRQRNAALRAIGERADIVVFFDDDFVPALDFLEQTERLFESRDDLAGVTGRVIADGIHNAGYTLEQGLRFIEEDQVPPPFEHPRQSLYGCNMAIRMRDAAGMSFDETLPLYGWQEDVDFTFRLGRKGRLIKSSLVRGVHLGSKSGRTAGAQFGYSQIANVIYLLRKRTIPPKLGYRLMTQNTLANIARCLRPEPHIDRAGRLKGNLLAIGDLLRGRLDPGRILELG